MKKLIVLIWMTLLHMSVSAQSKSDIFNSNAELTWLGLDFSQVHFIGAATQWQDVGDITNADLRDKYFIAWNEIFVDEKAKYDVAGATGRVIVKYATDVTASANAKTEKDYFVEDPGSFRHLDKDKVADVVRNYDYKGKKGIGMMFVVEGMHKEAKKASMWVVFVDMSSKTMLMAQQVEGAANGFGFRNFWAKAFLNGLKEVDDNFSKWKKKG